MPLLDHFQPPLKPGRHWTSFYSAWATCIAFDLIRRLPEGFVAEGNARFGIEIDVATFGDVTTPSDPETNWKPPAPTITVPFTAATDIVEVQVFNLSGGATLVGAIELVSPANKDREANRDAFVSKCAGCLQEGVGLVVIDVVTERKANLHDEILKYVSGPNQPWEVDLYAVSYHPVQQDVPRKFGRPTATPPGSLEIWPFELKVGALLPTVPFFLKGGLSFPLDLEAIYMHTCHESRIPLNGK